MESRAAKLALARQKLKDHQVKKLNHAENKSSIEDLSNIQLDTHHIQDVATVPNDSIPNNYQTETLTTVHTVNEPEKVEGKQSTEADLSITEMLISNKRMLEIQISDLQTKLLQQEESHAKLSSDYKECCYKISNLENELLSIKDKYEKAIQEISLKTSLLNESNNTKLAVSEENSNLGQQLELLKSIVSAKEAESDSLRTQLHNVQSQYDLVSLQLQQQVNGTTTCASNDKIAETEKQAGLMQKISYLEQQLNFLHKEKDQLNAHYEHFVSELNEQLKSVMKKNEELTNEVQHLSNRENSLIEQISDMEIRIQNFNPTMYENQHVVDNSPQLKDLQMELQKTVSDLNKLQVEHQELQNKYATELKNLQESSVKDESPTYDENISMLKLTADMTSDKIAAQRATEQNRKLKHDLQELEEAFVKMSKDKLELTEKVTAEKYLNRELTIKLAEIDENSKELQLKLKAKDEEMIRLQTNYRELEKKIETLNINLTDHSCHTHLEVCENNSDHRTKADENSNVHDDSMSDVVENKMRLQKEDAMSKLQERFLKIMSEVADLSDEKHRLEHIIVQLQTETDTICEYVALYQQQRSLLKRRDEERSVQLKLFQQECGKLELELEELNRILIRLSQDKELLPYFQTVTRKNDLDKVMTLLSNLKNNSLINHEKKVTEFKNFYPCHCCSGKLIDV